MRRLNILPVLVPFVLLLPACSSGGGGAAPAPGAPTGSVQVVLDTTAGSEVLLQAQVAAASLRRADGSITPNVLRSPQVITLADPSGEPETLLLRDVPDGTWSELHLLLVPGSAQASMPDGRTMPVDIPSADLGVSLGGGASHRRDRVTWLHLRHNGSLQFVGSGARGSWTPSFAGGPALGAELDATVQIASVRTADLIGTLGAGALHVEFVPGAELRDANDDPVADLTTFLASLRADDDIRVRGFLDDSGGLRCHGADHRGRRNDPRFIGRIAELLPQEQAFWMNVQAVARRGGERGLVVPTERVKVFAANAQIRFSHTHRMLTFSDLRVDDLVKVEWSRRAGNEIVAREIEVTGSQGQPMLPEFQGTVGAVDLTANTLILVPRHDDPIIVNGQRVDRLVVRLDQDTLLIRQAPSGGTRTTIGLNEVVPGQDRAWVRGEIVDPRTVAASYVRVRDDS